MMQVAKLPSFQFYPGDWMKDLALRSCSAFARGLLVDLLCMMFDSEQRGCLIAPSGKPYERDRIIRLISFGDSYEEVAKAFDELVENGVIKVHDEGYYYSARMVRDEELRQKRINAGSKGGSKKVANTLAKGLAKGLAKSKQIPEDEVEDEDSSRKGDARGKPEPAGFDKFWSGVPNKIGKGAARKAWQQAVSGGAKPEEIIGGLPGYVAYEQGRKKRDGNEYRPLHPSTWLNGERWADESTPTKPSGSKLDSLPPQHHDELVGALRAKYEHLRHLAAGQVEMRRAMSKELADGWQPKEVATCK